MNSTTNTQGLSLSLQQRMAAAVIAATLGSFMIIGIGFAQPAEIHNAAHDTRHAFTFPCH